MSVRVNCCLIVFTLVTVITVTLAVTLEHTDCGEYLVN